MGKLFKKLMDRRKGSKPFTGIDPGRGTSNTDPAPEDRNPGRGRGRRAQTPLGGNQSQM